MDIFVHKFVAFSLNKSGGQIQTEIHFVGTPFPYAFLPSEERLQMESSYSINIKEIKQEINSIQKNSKKVFFCGDPCLQSLPLEKLLTYCKELHINAGIETFGSKPAIIQKLINQDLLSSLTLKIYSPLHPRWISKVQLPSLSAQQDPINAIKKTITLLKNVSFPVTVKTIIVPTYLYRLEDLLAIAKEIDDLKYVTWILSRYMPSDLVSKQFRSLSSPSLEFVNDIKQELSLKYPSLKIVVE